jgi:predicted alpha/beta superfamily hydrolase
MELFPGAAGPAGPVVYVIDEPEFPFDLARVAVGREASVVCVPVGDWGDNLTPWHAESAFRGRPDYGGHAAATLEWLTASAIPSLERGRHLSPSRRAICGYSLGGLFSLYSFAHAGEFDACGCISGSVWYPGWVDHLREVCAAPGADLSGRFAFLSVGSREKHAPQPVLRSVEDNMGECARILRAGGCEVAFEVGPGSHMQHEVERYDLALSRLDEFLSR